ncbi:hypothetical protein [Nocardia camponoti]|uniref:Lipoprotein n=1 Tax=Nocardia camponoti TaxID=1616106 RepID=A0A917QB48_9NOCA|nr:hypothetical protein [Nocardia camponoti]GGK40646.1 hypothetical protein GCM10011591_10290 [Nocardia camponoti]
MKKQGFMRAAVTLSMATACVLTAACDRPSDEQIAAPAFNISFRWSAEANVDLQSAGLKSARAAIESNLVGEYLGVEYTYPGFPEFSDLARLSRNRGYTPGRPRLVEGVGTAYFHVIQRKSLGDHQAYYVCRDLTGTARKDGSSYPYPDAENIAETFDVVDVLVSSSPLPFDNRGNGTGTTKSPLSPLVKPEAPNRHSRPTGIVFVIDTVTFYAPSKSAVDETPCAQWFEQRWGTRDVPTPKRRVDEAPVVEPFTPGWE